MNIKKSNVFIYPLENKVIFPYHEYTFALNSNLYDAELHDNLIGFVTQLQNKASAKNIETIQKYSRFGTLLKIHKSDLSGYQIANGKKVYTVNLLGLTFARFRILSMVQKEGKIIANIEIFSDHISKQMESALQKKSLVPNLKKDMKVYYECKLKHNEAEVKKMLIDSQKSINKMIYKCINQIDFPLLEKLKLLEMNRQDEKINVILNFLKTKTENIKSIIDIEEKVRQDMSNSRVRASTTRNSMINSAGGRFGSFGGANTDLKELHEKVAQKKDLPAHVKQEIEKELKRTGGQTQTSIVMKYVETLLDIPWNQSNEEIHDIVKAEKILDEDHTGLKDVKERILEFLAVKFKQGNTKGNIICLHGPPGVGKTSIAKSIAKSLGREFTRISLGGLSDEAELRGHRRTYIAALPGVIIRALIKAKSNNPVILLDQIEKLGKSYKGDPEHALLQILDPSQNSSFVDHYVSIPVDLSKVMFICTANSLELSGPLLNRLELIEVPGYTREEKLAIAKNHLIPNQVKENGIEKEIEFSEEAIKEVIKYGREMGVRGLERSLGKICRKVARKSLTSKTKEQITPEKVTEILGPLYKPEKWAGIGVVNGMAWSTVGGKLLMVESISHPSTKPKVQVTGQLGDVMKESVNIGLSWIKAHINDYEFWGVSNLKIKEKFQEIEKNTIHIHFPEGATKKDGPSAGVTIVTSLLSLFLRVPPRENLSMTGEITLSGKVLPVGGVREKCIAAIYEGIKHIIIPETNLKDIEKIQPELKRDVQFYPVKDLKDVVMIAFPTLWAEVPPKL